MSKPTLTNTVAYLTHCSINWIEEYKYSFDYSDFGDVSFAYAKKTHNEQDLAFLILFYTRTLLNLETYHPWQIKEVDNKLNYISQSTSPLGTLTKQIRKLLKKSKTYSKVEIEKQLFDLANEARDLGFKIPYHFSSFKQAIQDVELIKPQVVEVSKTQNMDLSFVFPVAMVISFGTFLYSIIPELLVFFGGLILVYWMWRDVINAKFE